jgi:DNA-binding NtrC family response regulator
MARVVSATNRPLSGAPEDPLRADLYFRLAGYTIVTPRLADRLDDLALLAQSFMNRFAARYAFAPARITDAALVVLREHDWPGNVRELRVVIENAAVLAAPNAIDEKVIEHVLAVRSGEPTRDTAQSGTFAAVRASRASPGAVSLPEIQRDVILGAFSKYSPNLSKTAKYLGIPRSTLRDRLRKLGAL